MLDKNALPEIEKSISQKNMHEDRIPVACHYNPDTLLSKDGHLIQIIEVSGFSEGTFIEGKQEDIRQAVKDIIHESIPGYDYSVHINTIRSRKSLVPKGQLPFGVASDINNLWIKKNNWNRQLTNTLYITIIRQGLNFNVLNPANFIQALIPGQVTRTHIKFFEKASLELTQITNKIIGGLSNFGARKLNMIMTDKGYLSEPLFFYYNLVHLSQYRTPLPVKDFSEYIGNVDVAFGFNHLEITKQNEKRFAAIYSIKEQPELSSIMLDKFMQLGIEFIVSQSIVFVDKNEAQKVYDKDLILYKSSKAQNLLDASGLKDFLDCDTGKPTDYCKQQCIITVHSDSKERFDENIKKVVQVFSELGIVCAREDFNMPRLFWSQLPGNFKFLSRLNYKSYKNIAEFSCIHSYKSGNYKGSRWGPPISLFRQTDGAPFYFNFHNKHGNGNTLVVGPHGSGKTTLLRFILSQSARLNPHIVYIEMETSSKNFITSMGGKYYEMKEDEPNPLFKLNPFDLRAFKDNKEMLRNWLIKAIYPRAHQSDEYLQLFDVITNKVIQAPDSTDKIALVDELITNSGDAALIEGLNSFFKTDKFKKYFTSGNDDLSVFDSDNVVGINLAELKSRPVELQSIFGLLLQKIIKTLDGKPTIIAFNRLMSLYEIDSCADIFKDLLIDAQRKNAVIFAGSSKITQYKQHKQFFEDTQLFGTRIFLSDKFADKYMRRAYDLDDEEIFRIKSYSPSKHIFLLKKDGLSLTMSADLAEFEEQTKILCS